MPLCTAHRWPDHLWSRNKNDRELLASCTAPVWIQRRKRASIAQRLLAVSPPASFFHFPADLAAQLAIPTVRERQQKIPIKSRTMFSRITTTKSTTDCYDNITRLKEELATAGRSGDRSRFRAFRSAGSYTGERFRQYFGDFIEKYGFHDMYSGGFYPLTVWKNTGVCLSRYIYINRHLMPQIRFTIYLEAGADKEYFVLTTNEINVFRRPVSNTVCLYTQGDLWPLAVFQALATKDL